MTSMSVTLERFQGSKVGIYILEVVEVEIESHLGSTRTATSRSGALVCP